MSVALDDDLGLLRDSEDKNALVNRLHRIEGQVRGIERMVNDDRCCIDLLTQIGAANTALEALALKILDRHVGRCVNDALFAGEPAVAAKSRQELLSTVQRFTRTR